MDWDCWGKKLISMIDEAVMHKNKMDTISAVSAGRSAEQPIVKGVVAAAVVNPCEKEGPDKDEHTAETLSVTHKAMLA